MLTLADCNVNYKLNSKRKTHPLGGQAARPSINVDLFTFNSLFLAKGVFFLWYIMNPFICTFNLRCSAIIVFLPRPYPPPWYFIFNEARSVSGVNLSTSVWENASASCSVHRPMQLINIHIGYVWTWTAEPMKRSTSELLTSTSLNWNVTKVNCIAGVVSVLGNRPLQGKNQNIFWSFKIFLFAF